MSIAASLAALAQAKTDIAGAITAQGGTVGEGDGFASFAEDIATIHVGYKVEAADYTLDSGGTLSAVKSITYTCREVTEPAGAIILRKESNLGSAFGQHFIAMEGGVSWGDFTGGGNYSGSQNGSAYGNVSVSGNEITFSDPYNNPGYGFYAGQYRIIVWGY